MTQLTATFTVTIRTKPDGDYYFDHDDLVRNVVPWIEGGLDDRDDIAEVTITEQPAAVSAAVAPPTQAAAELRERLIDALANAHHTHPCPELGDKTWSGCVHYDDAGRMLGVGVCHSERRADAVLAVLPSAADWDALVREADRLRRDGKALHARAEEIDTQLAALRQQVTEPTDRAAVSREAEAELYVLLRKAGEPRDEAQALIDRHRGEVLRRAELRRMADETATETPAAHATHPCNAATMHRLGNLATAHGPHLWVMQPDMDPVRCPGTRKPAAGARVCKCPPELCACGHHQPAAGARQDGAET